MPAANLVLSHLERVGALTKAANAAIGHEAIQIREAIERLVLPSPLATELSLLKRKMGPIPNVSEGEHVIGNGLVALAALRIPLDRAVLASEEPRRRLIDRAFLHLNRTLMVDEDARRRWSDALKLEPRCERLGAVHLLSHGIYAFKADAVTGRTDLILGEPVRVDEEVESAAAMVLTEWKVARDGDARAKANEGRVQAERYAALELAGFELRKHRYIVLVSAEPVVLPPTETAGEITYHYVNVAIDRARPSVESRRSS